MSVSKVFARVRNFNSKSKTSKHKEPKRGLEIHAGVSAYNVTFSDLDESAFSIDKESKTATLKAIIPPYVPLYVYKTFVKIGLCLISEREVDNFAKCFRFLIDTSQDEKFEGMPFLAVNIHSIPGVQLFPQGTAVLYSRKQECETDMVPQKILVVYFANRIYQLFLPFNSSDAHIIGQQSSLITFPVLIDKLYFDRYGMYSTRSVNLSSPKSKIGQELKQVFTFGELQSF